MQIAFAATIPDDADTVLVAVEEERKLFPSARPVDEAAGGVVSRAIATGRYDGYLALGCVIRGETSHYDHICNEVARGINELAIRHMAPVGFGVLTVETMEQARRRADPAGRNKGREAAVACLKMVELAATLRVTG